MSAYVSKYSWKSGYSYKTSADVVGKVLTEIEERDGEVTSRTFLEYSRPEDSETHDMFEWDDSIAAEKYRLVQSGKIINQLQVELVRVGDSAPRQLNIEVERQEPVQRVSAFVNVAPRGPMMTASFNNFVNAMSDEEKSRQVLENALADLKAIEEKYKMYEELADVFAAIHDFEDELDGAS